MTGIIIIILFGIILCIFLGVNATSRQAQVSRSAGFSWHNYYFTSGKCKRASKEVVNSLSPALCTDKYERPRGSVTEPRLSGPGACRAWERPPGELWLTQYSLVRLEVIFYHVTRGAQYNSVRINLFRTNSYLQWRLSKRQSLLRVGAKMVQ